MITSDTEPKLYHILDANEFSEEELWRIIDFIRSIKSDYKFELTKEWKGTTDTRSVKKMTFIPMK